MSVTYNVQNIIKDLANKLSNQELTELSVELADYVEIVGAELSADEIADKRFAEGLVCPYRNKRHLLSKKSNCNWVAPRNSGKSHKRDKEIDYRSISHKIPC